MRPASELSYQSRINRVAAFVAANLAGTLDGASLAREAALSRFHFQRVFRRMTGLTPAEYVEFARLGRAIAHLRQGGQQVGRIAAEVGYETGASLAKALRRRFGVAPSGLRRPEPGPPEPRRLDVSAFQRPRRDTRLCARFLELPPQSLLCTPVRGMISRGLAAVHDQARVRLVTEADRLGLLERLAGDMILIPAAPVGPDDPAFTILVGFLLQGPPLAPPALVPPIQVMTLEGGRFAVFRHLGPRDTVWQTWFRVFHDWVPGSGVRLRPGLSFQRPAAANQPATDLHIPVY